VTAFVVAALAAATATVLPTPAAPAFAATSRVVAATAGRMGHRWPRGLLGPGGVAVEGRGRCRGGQRHLLEKQIVSCLEEGAKRPVTTDVATDGGELLVEAADEGEDEQLVVDRRTKVGEVISHRLQALAVVRDTQVPLLEVTELSVEEDGARLLVSKELGLDGNPCRASRGALVAAGHDDVDELVGNGAVEPRADDAVHANPISMGEDRGLTKYVILQRVFADGKEKLLAPTSVVTGGGVEDDGDEKADVLDGDRLGIQMQECLRLVHKQGAAGIQCWRFIVVLERVFFVGGERRLLARGRSTLQGGPDACIGLVSFPLGCSGLLLGSCSAG